MSSLFLILFGVLVIILTVALLGASALLDKGRKTEALKRVQDTAAQPGVAQRAAKVFVEPPSVANRPVSERWPLLRSMSRQLRYSGLTWTAGGAACGMLALAAFGAILGWNVPVLMYQGFSSAALAFALGYLPLAYIRRAGNKRIAAFEGQFPEALDFFARAVRAGHAFSTSLELMANESPEPIRSEFRRIHTEHSLGAPLEVALTGLLDRVPLVDVKFFVSAVLLQRETGGNLSEILDHLAQVIRGRFALKGKVKAAAAHGRMTAMALTIIPILILAGFALLSPEYVRTFKQDSDARIMFVACVVGQVVAYLWMKKIINIKV